VVEKTIDPATIAELAEWLHQFVYKYLRRRRVAKAEVSKALLYDVARHWMIDMRRIGDTETSSDRLKSVTHRLKAIG